MNERLGWSPLWVRALVAGSQKWPTAAALSTGHRAALADADPVVPGPPAPDAFLRGATTMSAVRHPVIPEALPPAHSSGLPLIAR